MSTRTFDRRTRSLGTVRFSTTGSSRATQLCAPPSDVRMLDEQSSSTECALLEPKARGVLGEARPRKDAARPQD